MRNLTKQHGDPTKQASFWGIWKAFSFDYAKHFHFVHDFVHNFLRDIDYKNS